MAVLPLFRVTLNSQKTYSHGCKRQNNGSVLLKITLQVHRNWFHSSLAEDGQDGNGLQLEKIDEYFHCQVLPVYFEKYAKIIF